MNPKPRLRRHTGFTLVELLVAMLLGLLVSLAAASTLLVARQGFDAVDAASQMRDHTRFVVDILERLASQAGYRDLYHATAQHGFRLEGTAEPSVTGYDNATLDGAHPPGARSAKDINGSDVLILRAMANARPGTQDSRAGDAGEPVSDGGIINCLGHAPGPEPAGSGGWVTSYLYVSASSSSDSEPALMCAAPNDKGTLVREPLARGVETFQVLYGIDESTDADLTGGIGAFRFKRADQIASAAEWRQVRSLRIGLVMRGPAAPGLSSAGSGSLDYYPLGESFSASSDPGSRFSASQDGRPRQAITLAIQLRNAMSGSF